MFSNMWLNMKFIAPSRSETKTSSQKITHGQKYWVRSKLWKHIQPSQQIHTCKHWWEGNESTFFLSPEQVLTLFGVLCAQAGERVHTACWLLLLWKLARDKRPGKWRKMTSKDWKPAKWAFLSSFLPFCYMNVLKMPSSEECRKENGGRWTKVKGLPSLLSLASAA